MNVDEYYQIGRYGDTTNTKERMPYFNKRVEIYSRLINPKKIKKILDAGCGAGGLAHVMREKWNVEAYGVDISKKGVSLARKIGIKAKVSDLSSSMQFESNFFDLIIANELIEHLSNPDGFLRESRRVLKKGGFLLISTPNLSYWLNRVLFSLGIYPIFLEASVERKVGLGHLSSFSFGNQPVGHIHVFNSSAIIELLKLNGFTVEKKMGLPIDFISPNRPLATKIYGLVDNFFSRFFALSADLVILAKK